MARTVKRRHHNVTFSVLVLGVAAYALLQSMVIPVLPTIQHQLHTSQDTVTWVVTAYLLSASVFTPLLGRIGDAVGKERMLVVTLAGLAIGSLLAALAGSITLMIIARVVQGVGGGVLPVAFGIVRDEFPQRKVNGAIGNLAALTAVGGGLGLVLAGPIVDSLGYHWLFWVPLIMVSVAALAAYLLVPASPVHTGGRVSWSAAILLSTWLIALLLAMSEGPVWGWTSVRVLALMGGSAVLAAGWVAVEARSGHPLVDMHMMRIPTVWTTNLVAFLFGVTMYGVMTFLPQFVQTPRSAGYGFGATVTGSGLFLLPLTVTMFAGGAVSGGLAGRFGSKAVLAAGSAVCIVPALLLTYGHGSAGLIYLASGALGIGVGLAFSAMSALVVETVPAEQTGVASGMNANIRTIGGSIGCAIMASIVTSGAAPGGLPKVSGYTNGFLFMTVATVLATVATLFIPTVRRVFAPTLEMDGEGPEIVAAVAGAPLLEAEPSSYAT